MSDTAAVGSSKPKLPAHLNMQCPVMFVRVVVCCSSWGLDLRWRAPFALVMVSWSGITVDMDEAGLYIDVSAIKACMLE